MDTLIDGDYEVSEWKARREAVESNWETARSFLYTRVLESNAIPEVDTLCHKCNEAVASVTCIDCLGALLCTQCDYIMHHSQPFHDRQTWKNGFFEMLPQGQCCCCNVAFYKFVFDNIPFYTPSHRLLAV